MSIALEPQIMTTEQLLAMPEDGIDRELFRGQMRERPMTCRNRRHSRTTIRIGQVLENWRDAQPPPRGEVVGGEAGFRLRRNPDSTVGIDVAYISAELAAATPETVSLIDGPPILAVEILSPSDTHEDVSDKVMEYLDAGVALVWVADPAFRTIAVYKPGEEPALFNARQHVDGGEALPGFRALVADLFA